MSERETNGTGTGTGMDDPVTRRYQPPFDEFQLEVLTVGAGGAYKVAASPGRRVVHSFSHTPPPPPPPP